MRYTILSMREEQQGEMTTMDRKQGIVKDAILLILLCKRSKNVINQ